MNEQLDFEERVFAMISSKEQTKSIQVEFFGFADQQEMNLFKDFISVTLGINQFKQENVIDRENTLIH